MIKACFFRKNDLLVGFSVSGHSGYAESGFDIVCAAVSSAVQLTANNITDFFGIAAKVSADENTVSLRLEVLSDDADKLINGLLTHLEFISEEFENNVDIKFTEV